MSLITAHFHDVELCVSRDNPTLVTPLDELEARIVANATRLIVAYLEPVRELAGILDVLSFYRSLELNGATPGAVPDSDHLEGLACDFKPREVSGATVLELSRALADGGLAAWDKLNLYTASDTLHVANRAPELGAPRRRIFVDWQEVE